LINFRPAFGVAITAISVAVRTASILNKALSIHFDWRVLAAAPNIPYKTASASHTPRFVGCCQAANRKSRLMIHHQRQIRRYVSLVHSLVGGAEPRHPFSIIAALQSSPVVSTSSCDLQTLRNMTSPGAAYGDDTHLQEIELVPHASQ
jgi:hypothetical protein